MSKTIGSNLDRKFFGHMVYIKNEVTRELGTGTLIKNGDKWYVITASHVIKRASPETLYMNLGIRHGSRLEKTQILVDDPDLDFALIKVDAFEASIKLGEHNSPYGFNAKATLAEAPHFNRMAITGYPNYLVEDRQSEYPERVFFSIWEKLPSDPETWPQDLKGQVNPDLFLLIDFHPDRTSPFIDKKGNPQPIFDLHGMSGCPVWVLDKDSTNDSNPKYGFYGVFTGFWPKSKMWQFTRIDAILAKLKEKYNIDLLAPDSASGS